MKTEKKYSYLLKNFGILTLSSFGTRILSILLVPIYTRYLSTGEYGTFDLFTTTITLLVPILTLNIAESVLRFSLDDKYDPNEIWSVGCRYSIYACAIFCFIVLVNHIFFIMPVFSQFSLELVFLFIGTFFYDLFSRFARGIDNVISTAVAGIINSIVLLVLNIFFLTQFNLGLKGFLWAYCLSYFIPIIYYCFSLKIWKYCRRRVRENIAKEMVEYSAPLVMDTVGWWVNNASDRYIITWICGVTVNGIYSVSYKIPSILNMINSIFGQAWTLSAVKEFKDDVTRDTFYSNIYKLYNCGMVTVCSLLIMFDKLIAKILFAKEFYNGWMYAPFLMISVVFSALMVVMGGVYLAAKKSKELGIITVLGAVFNTVLNIILINLVGTIGAAISTMVTYIFVWIIRIIRMKQIAKLLINLKRDFFAYFILVLQSVLLFFKINNYLLYGIELLLFWTIIFLYRNDIRHAIEKFFKRRII